MEEVTRVRLIEEICSNRRLVHSLCVRILSRQSDPSVDAEDMTQEILFKASQRLETFREGASLQTWIYRVTYNHCIDFLRKTKRRPQHTQEEEIDQPNGYKTFINNPETAYIQSIGMRRALKKVLIGFNPQLRRTIFMYIEGRSENEIAQKLKIARGTVKSRLSKVREALHRNY